jgi:hypothetical protein
MPFRRCFRATPDARFHPVDLESIASRACDLRAPRPPDAFGRVLKSIQVSRGDRSQFAARVSRRRPRRCRAGFTKRFEHSDGRKSDHDDYKPERTIVESVRISKSFPMSVYVAPGTKRIVEGRLRVFYDGYWVRAYEVPADTLSAKKRLIEALTTRLFNHVEHGLNIPGLRLNDARSAYESETDPQRKRVKGAMLAGALFNRATDLITKLVEVQALGVEIEPDNELMRACGEHLQEALALGKMVLHRSGEEGIDELWGEPFKAFAFPIEDFYRSRYVKIAQTMAAIDFIGAEMTRLFGSLAIFGGIEPLVGELVKAAKSKCETLRTDKDIFDVWTSFAVAAERLAAYKPSLPADATAREHEWAAQGAHLLRRGKDLISDITRARVPMPKSTREYTEECERYRRACATSAREGIIGLNLVS